MSPSHPLPPDIEVLERGWLSSNNILLHGAEPDEGAVLIDTGYVTHADQTLALLDAALRPNERIRLIANTHLHSDHCGGNAAVSARHGCPIVIPPGEFAAIAAWDEDALSYRATGQRCARFSPAGALLPGHVVHQAGREWQVLSAPGHDPHSLILFDTRSGTLISADALWQTGFGIVFPELDGDHAFDEVEATLELIEKLGPSWVIPGHGAPFHDLASALRVARERLRYFRQNPKRHALHAAKALTVFHMLEVRENLQHDLIGWLLATPVLQSTWQRYFADRKQDAWVQEMVDDLIRAKVLGYKSTGSIHVVFAIGN
ncbi:MBL fold metallo-hydrolase [Roseateles sp. So40a]|uniref:MBL fold metallo-hydrolase n=1 Tax=Roseateles sp. So40a TaxID=3400226 RepID=UPI003A899631